MNKPVSDIPTSELPYGPARDALLKLAQEHPGIYCYTPAGADWHNIWLEPLARTEFCRVSVEEWKEDWDALVWLVGYALAHDGKVPA